ARPHAPGIFAVKVRFVDPVLEEKRSESFLESADAAIEHRVEAGGVIDAVAIVAETPEAAREIVSQIVQTLAANVGSGFQEVRAPKKRRQVIDKLVISLITLDGKGPGVSNDRAIARATGKREADHWRVIAGADVYES